MVVKPGNCLSFSAGHCFRAAKFAPDRKRRNSREVCIRWVGQGAKPNSSLRTIRCPTIIPAPIADLHSLLIFRSFRRGRFESISQISMQNAFQDSFVTSGIENPFSHQSSQGPDAITRCTFQSIDIGTQGFDEWRSRQKTSRSGRAKGPATVLPRHSTHRHKKINAPM
jgi:hypothetical protein